MEPRTRAKRCERHVLLLTGVPGVGKTTLIRKVAAQLSGFRLAGFYTEEVRDGTGGRTGFLARTFGGERRTIADVRFPSSRRVGKYGIDLGALDHLAEAELQLREDVDLYLIDEIGKMECLSGRFVQATTRLLESSRPILATVGARGTGLIADVKRLPRAELWNVTVGNRQRLPDQIVAWLLQNGHLGGATAGSIESI